MATSFYGVVFPEFWTGRTGRELRRRGGKDAQLLGLYLATNRHTNMLGLYRLSLEDIQHETGLKVGEIAKALTVLEAVDFARYDVASEFVWVLTMYRFRLNLQPGQALAGGDKRIVALNKLYHALDANPFLGAFYEATVDALQISKPRKAEGLAVSPSTLTSPSKGASKGLRSGIDADAAPDVAVSKGHPSPSEGASKPLPSQYQDQDQKQDQVPEIRKQEKAGRSATDLDHEPVNVNVLTRLAHDAIDDLGATASYADLADLLKTLARRHKVAMTPDAVTAALESALHQRTQWRRA